MAHVIRRGIRTQLLLVGLLVSLSSGRVWAQQCLGDCNGDNTVSAPELTNIIGLINCCPCGDSLLGGAPGGCSATGGCASLFPSGVPQCAAADRNGNQCITAGELTGVIANILNYMDTGGCPPLPSTMTPTNTPPPTNTPTNTPPPTNTPTNTETPALTFTPSNTPLNTSTPTNTPPNTSTPTQTPTFTVANTNTPTNSPTPPATNTPTVTNTPAASSTPTNTPTQPAGPVCGNGSTESGEQCDDGGTCVGGANAGQKCPANAPNVPGGVDCGAGVCTPFGGDGCAVNCTTETLVPFAFTGAKCYGGANNGRECTYQKYCVGGTLPGRPCTSSSNCPGTGVSCVDECGLTNLSPSPGPTPTNDGSQCAGIGGCVSANPSTLVGAACPSTNNSGFSGSSTIVKQCQNAGTKTGLICSNVSACSGGGGSPTCVNPCAPSGGTGLCRSKTGAILDSIAFNILVIGPISGGETLAVGQPSAGDPDQLVPVSVPSSGVFFRPVKVPGLACACPHGVPEPEVHGPGNSGTGLIGCGTSGLVDANVDLSEDHNTTPPNICLGGTSSGAACNPNSQCPGGVCDASLLLCTGGSNGGQGCDPNVDCSGGTCNSNNGAGTCSGGTRNGLACSTLSTDCPGGGTCTGTGQGGGVCVSGTNAGKVCHVAADCPGSICNSVDDPTCTLQDVPPAPGSGVPPSLANLQSQGSGVAPCLEKKEKCFGGPTAGLACTSDTDCNGGTCGTTCNLQSKHPGVCNSAFHLTYSGGPSGTGAGLIVTTTAIGVIGPAPDDAGTCSKAAQCMPFAFNTTLNPEGCVIDADCGTGHVCGTAYCAGICNTGPLTGSPCAGDSNCGGTPGSCTAGPNFGKACTTANDAVCGDPNQNICTPMIAAKGYDGLPCTADDPLTSQGTANTLPTTTETATSGVTDTNNTAGAQLYHGLCTGSTNCQTSAQGSRFDCSKLLAPTPSVTGTTLASAYPQVEGTTTEDSVITNVLTAK